MQEFMENTSNVASVLSSSFTALEWQVPAVSVPGYLRRKKKLA